MIGGKMISWCAEAPRWTIEQFLRKRNALSGSVILYPNDALRPNRYHFAHDHFAKSLRLVLISSSIAIVFPTIEFAGVVVVFWLRRFATFIL
jgi:hypothetical protein